MPNDIRGLASVPTAIRMGYRLAYSAAGFHRRARLLHCFHGGSVLRDAARDLSSHIELLDEDFLGFLCDGCGVRHHHAFPVRNELEPVFGRNRQHHFTAAGL